MIKVEDYVNSPVIKNKGYSKTLLDKIFPKTESQNAEIFDKENSNSGSRSKNAKIQNNR